MAEPNPSSNPPTSTKRLDFQRQTLEDAYAVPANQLEIEVTSPETHYEGGKKKFTDYLVNFKVSSFCRLRSEVNSELLFIEALHILGILKSDLISRQIRFVDVHCCIVWLVNFILGGVIVC